MDVLRIIPQIFFDLIARVVPGVVALALLVWIHPQLSWSGMLNVVSGGSLRGENAFGFVFFGSLFAGFVIGHLLSPAAKLLEELTASDTPMPWRRYDWLRVHRADAGALAAKIRAEYTMHFAFAAAFGMTSIGALGMNLFQHSQAPEWIELAVLVATSISSVHRARTVRKSFGNGVEQLYAAAMQELPVAPPILPATEPNHDR